jgi:hypothetical protein
LNVGEGGVFRHKCKGATLFNCQYFNVLFAPEFFLAWITPPPTLTCVITQANLFGQSTQPGQSTYQWTAEPPGNIVSGQDSIFAVADAPGTYILQITPLIDNLGAGFFEVTVTDSDGCTAVTNAIVTQPASELTVGTSATTPSGVGASDGTATASPTGGTPGYTYLWSNSGIAATITGLVQGIYTVTVTDANGCTQVATAQVGDFECNLLVGFTVTNPSCATTADGSTTVLPTGGADPYAFLWSNTSTQQTNSGLLEGSYTVTVTDANGCTVAMPVGLQAIDQVQPVIQANPATVALGATGSVTLTPALLGVVVTDNCAVGNVSLNPINFNCTQLGEHQVMITATDASGNTATAAVTVTIIDNITPELVCPGNIVRCFGNDVVQYSAPVATDNCLGIGGSFNLDAGLPSGSTFPAGETINTYSYTDAQGNVGACSFNVTILSQLVVNLDTVINDVSNQNVGGVQVTVTGSLAPYTYQWTVNGQPVASTEDLSGVGAGTYSLQVSDNANCQTVVGPYDVKNISGTKNPAWSDLIGIYPNPTSGRLFIVLPDQLVGAEINIQQKAPATPLRNRGTCPSVHRFITFKFAFLLSETQSPFPPSPLTNSFWQPHRHFRRVEIMLQRHLFQSAAQRRIFHYLGKHITTFRIKSRKHIHANGL